MENQMTALSSVSIEEETLSKLLVEACANTSPDRYKTAADLAVEAVKSAFAKLRGQNEVGQMTVSLGVKVDDQVLQCLNHIAQEVNGLSEKVSDSNARLTHVITTLSDKNYPELKGV